MVTFLPRSNTHKFQLRPFDLDEALSGPVPLPSDDKTEIIKQDKDTGESIIRDNCSQEEVAGEGETIEGVATIRRGLVRARRKQREAHQSRHSSILSKKLCPPSLIEGGIFEIGHQSSNNREGHHDRHDGESWEQQTVTRITKRSILASGPILVAYFKHWLYKSRVDRRLNALTTSYGLVWMRR